MTELLRNCEWGDHLPILLHPDELDVRRHVVRDRVLDLAHQGEVAGAGAHLHLEEQLHHHLLEEPHVARHAQAGVNHDAHAALRAQKDLQPPRAVQRRILQVQQALVHDIRPPLGRVLVVLGVVAPVLFAEQLVLAALRLYGLQRAVL
ncbi:essential for mitotic growth 1 [Strigomonas culicis]|uniref:Essential for mitotic growth 1 n=1 Tax=Strigomonas culicis TaxID=28005 RepID=S9V4M2_9TRYP|nr:essential for mitotic growth 1 [Strigomonas culicis]EPY24066.1 essential for mitotic growth 1 [Strigomonas culicis]|eukprot:EPY21856.1 essential for mitotic growth 1 [Strigomonas culicis]